MRGGLLWHGAATSYPMLNDAAGWHQSPSRPHFHQRCEVATWVVSSVVCDGITVIRVQTSNEKAAFRCPCETR